MEPNKELSPSESKSSNIRRSHTLRTNAARQVAVNFMPSRQLPYNTLRNRRKASEHNAMLDETDADGDDSNSAEKQANSIVREMEQHQRLMEDDPEAKELRREALRDLPQCLTMKRTVRAKLSASVSLRSKRRPISMWKRLKYRISFAWKSAGDRVRDFVFSIELWYEAIRNIEGHFGSAVGSYFYFLRWLFVMNAVLVLMISCLVVLPQALHQPGNITEHNGLDIITGMGRYENSLLFYGYYHYGDINNSGPLTYNMPFAYFFTMVCSYLALFVVLCIRTAYSYRRNFIDTADALPHVFASKVFCGWDYGIATQHAATLNATSIYNEFKELLSDQNKKKLATSFCAKTGQYTCNVLVTCIVLSVIVGLEYGLWRLLSIEPTVRHWPLIVSAIVTLVVLLCPLLFNLVVKLEYYQRRTAFYVTLARTWLLDVGTLMLLFVYWTRSNDTCWETSFGQETYRLVLLDALISLFVLPVIEFTRGLIYKINKSGNAPEFDIVYNSLTLIYNQAVLWFGMLFSPPLVVAVTIKFLLLFYVKRECAMRACHPARKVWRASQTQTVLYMLVTLSLFATLFGVGSLFFGRSSQCGPFRQYETVYSVVSEGVLKLSQYPTATRVLQFVTRPGVIALFMLMLCVLVYYMRSRALARRTMVQILRHMLVLQARDKDFLLAAIHKVSHSEWLYSPKPDDDLNPNSHTFKYLKDVRKPSNVDYNFDASRLSHSFLERPRSYAKENRPSSYHAEGNHSRDDGDTDSSFSWQGSSSYLNQKGHVDVERKWL